jgi:hypothetical protein
MHRCFVVTHIEGRWCLTARDALLANFSSREDAIVEGLRMAQSNEPSRLIIHRENGTTEQERSFNAAWDFSRPVP